MAELSVLNTDILVSGTLSASSFNPPDGCITNAAVKSLAGIDHTKLVHYHPIRYSQAGGTAVVADNAMIHTCRAGATIRSFEAVVETPATDASRTVTLDLLKGNNSTAFATVLTAPIVLTNLTAARTVVTAAITSPTLADNDILKLTCVVAGAVGNQAQGLNVTTFVSEASQ